MRFLRIDSFVGVVNGSDSVCPDSSGGGGSLELLAPTSVNRGVLNLEEFRTHTKFA